MKRFLWSVMLATLAVVPCTAQSQTMSASMYGVGPHGFDWAIGTWSCTNSMPSPMGGPSSQTLTVARTNGGAIFYRASGDNFDNSWYNVYVPKTKKWVSPFIVADGSYGSESTTETGKKIVWRGSVFDAASGKTMQIRDTNEYGAAKWTDLGESQSAGTWKTQYDIACTKT